MEVASWKTTAYITGQLCDIIRAEVRSRLANRHIEDADLNRRVVAHDATAIELESRFSGEDWDAFVTTMEAEYTDLAFKLETLKAENEATKRALREAGSFAAEHSSKLGERHSRLLEGITPDEDELVDILNEASCEAEVLRRMLNRAMEAGRA